MKTSLEPHPLSPDTAQRAPQDGSGHWLAWTRFVGIWLLCMLLCANLALVLAQWLPAADRADAKSATPQRVTPAHSATYTG